MAVFHAGYILCFGLVYCLVIVANAVEPEFKLQPLECSSANCDRLVGFTLDPSTKRLYVVTKKTVKELDKGLKILREIKTSTLPVVNNVLMLLKDSDLLLCMNNGTCELRDVTTLDLVGSGYSKGDIIPNKRGPAIGWVDKGPGGVNILNVAVSNVEVTDRTIPLVASRRLPTKGDSSKEFLHYLKDNFSIPSSFFQPSSCSVDKISPVYGFSAGMYRFLLKLHKNESTSQVKIIRLCRESSTYRSYIELPIRCDDENSIDFDELVMTAAYFTNDVLYISFTKRSGGHPVTNVCAYKISQINDAFRQRRKECMTGKTESTELGWNRYNFCPTVPLHPPQFDVSQLDNKEFCYDLPIAHPLGGHKPITESAMTFMNVNVMVTAIVVAPSHDTLDTVYLVGDNEGHVHKIFREQDKVDVSVDDGHKILSLALNGDTCYAMTDRMIRLIPLIEPKKVKDQPSSVQQNNHRTPQQNNHRPPQPDNHRRPQPNNFHPRQENQFQEQRERNFQNPPWPQENVHEPPKNSFPSNDDDTLFIVGLMIIIAIIGILIACSKCLECLKSNDEFKNKYP